MDIKLVVVRTADVKKLTDFYSLFGLDFESHKHESSPYHFAATIGNTVFEVYPLAKGQAMPDKNLRLGFSIDNFDMVLARLKQEGVVFAADPSQTDFGYLAIVVDPDGRKIELYKR